MAMAQKDRNARLAQKAFEMVDRYGKSQKITSPVLYVPRDEPAPRFHQNSYEYGGPNVYTVKEGTNTTASCRRVIYQYSNDSTIKEPVVSHPTEHIQYFGGASPFTGHANRFERPKGRAISCDEAVKLYGGVLIKEYRN